MLLISTITSFGEAFHFRGVHGDGQMGTVVDRHEKGRIGAAANHTSGKGANLDLVIIQ